MDNNSKTGGTLRQLAANAWPKRITSSTMLLRCCDFGAHVSFPLAASPSINGLKGLAICIHTLTRLHCCTLRMGVAFGIPKCRFPLGGVIPSQLFLPSCAPSKAFCCFYAWHCTRICTVLLLGQRIRPSGVWLPHWMPYSLHIVFPFLHIIGIWYKPLVFIYCRCDPSIFVASGVSEGISLLMPCELFLH